MEAEIIAIGTELLLGATVDTNSAFIAQRLATVGVPLRRVTLVRDDIGEIVAAISEALERVELVVCSGGLGPTGDDLTREAVAEATGRPLEFHQELLDDIAARFASFRRTMSPSNRRQAFVPANSYIIRNPHGTAPAFVAKASTSLSDRPEDPTDLPGRPKRDGHYVAALPGVPQELYFLVDQALLPYLRDELGQTDVLLVREVRLSGLTEALAGERISDIMPGDNPVVGITAKRGQYTIRIAGRGNSHAAAEALIAPLVEIVRSRFVGYVLDDELLEQRVPRLMAERGLRLELVEDTPEAPIFRAWTSGENGRATLARATVDLGLRTNGMQAALDLALDRAAGGATGLAALTARGDGSWGTLYIALADGTGPPATLERGIDFGLAQAHEFVASAALELLRRRLEATSGDAVDAPAARDASA